MDRRWAVPVLVAGGSLAVLAYLRRRPPLVRFASLVIPHDKVALRSRKGHAVALHSLQRITPTHLLVIPTRPVSRLDELTPEEASDLFAVARQATASAEARQGSTASNWALKEGLSTGPAVSHLHLHIVPRVSGDFVENDLVYAALDAWSPHEGQTNTTPGWDIPPDSQRTDRTAADMAGEARRYRGHLRTGSDGVMPSEQRFGRFTLPGEQLFYLSPSGLTVAIVNLRPLTPGHVLVLARRCVPRLEDLTADEFADLWVSVREVQGALRKEYGATGFNIGVQDGKGAGQSVPHVHVHILPKLVHIQPKL